MLLFDVYRDYASSIHGALQDIHNHQNDAETCNPLFDIGGYALEGQGKMLRGVMLLEACRTVGGDPEQIIYAAAGTEYGHLASLIHDDIIDQDELRRGKKTIWQQYGSNFAILAGDLFIFEAYYALSLCRHTIPAERVARTLEVLSKACIDLCLGQALETQLVRNCTARSADYIKVVRDKTGSLFRAAVESGAVLGGANEEQITAMHIFGDSLGIAFQIIDDLLSYRERHQDIRKPKTSDTKNQRMTLPVLYALDSANTPDRETLINIFSGPPIDDLKLDCVHEQVIAILKRTGAIEQAEQTALDYQQQALNQLTIFNPNVGREHLEIISYMAVRREQ